MPIRLVILDADESLWRGRAGRMELPFKRLDDNTVSDLTGQKIRVHPRTRELLLRLRESNIAVGMASWNRREKVEQILRLLGMLEFFPDPLRKIWYERGRMKHLMIQEMVEEASRETPSLEYSQVLFYDDDPSYFENIRRLVSPEIHCIQAGIDMKTPYEILQYIKRTK